MPEPKNNKYRLLILGGTGEATMLATALTRLYPVEIDLIVSLAGRTEEPSAVPGRTRIGGFGGVQGMIDYLRDEDVDAVVDATHPFAASISANARRACEVLDIPRMMLIRPDWVPQANDQWIEAADMAAAAILPVLGRRVFMTIGRQNLSMFSEVRGVHFVVRLLEEPKEPLPLADYSVVVERPPFTVEHECKILSGHGINVIVSKSSGGKAGASKLIAARLLSLPVLMISRPRRETGVQRMTILAAVKWVKRLVEAHTGVSLLD